MPPASSAAVRVESTSSRSSLMLDIFRKRRMWRPASSLKSSYDVVIIGGGSHGLATAHYLRDHGITDVAILEKRYIGSCGARRQTTMSRSTYIKSARRPL